ncbi:bacteriochlorophyll 4-vinyl reductase [Heliophilum fasciatum]|uniref:Divinyl protochlorophyllide a 8-vinyl-reductase n=1 Tax=Heliophilum fasciatum TaxID=35700 RepID=A0A4R2RZV0_9FIRM|nr:bacteriochlorophyll 4-vinyl reductase [Heliophilum fasciatum]MCW2277047.1 divinyl protochlorophyllide a 8-vinyl-reductase [Heliophilum fasciatum]TCP68427.1 divinyl protochlorophyllide a 8-vinyl-reductase [Heliophilum fasciatum]
MGSSKIGPNSIIQTIRVLQEYYGREKAEQILQAGQSPWQAGKLPAEMVDEDVFLELIHLLRDQLGLDQAKLVLSKAGDYTAEYLLANRIPKPMKWLFPLMPRKMRMKILMTAIGNHAWTFAGSGRFHFHPEPKPMFIIEDCITSRDIVAETPVCSFYSATFEGLLRCLVDSRINVIEKSCRASGQEQCEFFIQFR